MKTSPLRPIVLFAIAAFLSGAPATFGQQASSDAATKAVGAPSPQNESGVRSNDMDAMAQSVTRAATMCETMMQHEMAMMPYKIALGAAIATIAVVALILLVVLEIQWIIHWKRLLKRSDETSG